MIAKSQRNECGKFGRDKEQVISFGNPKTSDKEAEPNLSTVALPRLQRLPQRAAIGVSAALHSSSNTGGQDGVPVSSLISPGF